MFRTVVSFALVLTSTVSVAFAADDAALQGKWSSDKNGRHVEMEFTPDGQAHFKSTEKGKSTGVNGTYEVKADHLLVTARDKRKFNYTMNLNGNTLTLNGGWMAANQPLTLTRTGGAAAAAPATPATPNEKDKPAVTEKPKNGGGAAADKDRATARPDLPGGKWDTRALEQAFTVVKTSYDANANKVTWLLEKNVDGFLAFDASFYDADDVKLGSNYLNFDPSLASVSKSERTRATIELPKEDLMKKVTKVVITKR